ncbi:cytosine permease [Niallia oryzisoli]|uniref:Cytosine permease n=1 Tax=Niallia oryzisoli TaxID=1737571 RepID=A0ABZ2C9W7_9BACI
MSDQEYSETEGSYPLLPNERTWRPRDLLMVLISTSVATWCFLVGGYVGLYLNAKMGIAAFTAGTMIGMLFVSLAVIPITAKYGIDSITSSKPFFGNRGFIIALLLQYLSVIGWNSIRIIFFTKAATHILVLSNVFSETMSSILLSLLAIVAVITIWFLMKLGSRAVKHLSTILAIPTILIGIWMLIMIINIFGYQTITEVKPAYSSNDRLWNYTTGIEIGLISIIAWWPYLGGIVRIVPKASQTTLPSIIGLSFPVSLMSFIGLLSVLLMNDPDPTSWMVELGGSLYGTIALAFIAVTNFGSAVIGVYISCIGLRNLSILKKRSWNATILITLIPIAVVSVFIPELFFDKFSNFLTFLGVLIAPLVGIQIIDHFIFRKKQLHVKHLYDAGPNSVYSFWKGWNPASIIALLCGVLTYFYLLNPLTYESHAPYQYLTATLPTMAVGAFVYLIITQFVIIPFGWGGYRKRSK